MHNLCMQAQHIHQICFTQNWPDSCKQEKPEFIKTKQVMAIHQFPVKVIFNLIPTTSAACQSVCHRNDQNLLPQDGQTSPTDRLT